mmetsp:Transcript_28972/g.45427  ORF Transcript_28972/g.45427 Transcript_28972/m.45427 type:complete len:421 (-) Transcript_28972:276-1538(-)
MALVAEAASPKHISAQELRDYLHLPAKDVAKELGVCLTSLKKICRQHGILRWPYRRLKMLDRKIQTLEHSMAEGVEDPEEIRKQLEKLQSQRNSLPSNYGTCAADDEDDSPSSPLSCASTAVQGLDAPASRSPVDEGSEGDFDVSSTDTPTTPTALSNPLGFEYEVAGHAPMTAAAALISNISGSAAKRPASTQGTPLLQKAPKAFRHHTPGTQTSTSKSNTPSPKTQEEPGKVKTSTQGDGSMKVELCVPADIAGQVAQGAQLVVHQVNGKATLEIIPQSPSPTGGSNMVFELPQLPDSSAEAAEQLSEAIPIPMPATAAAQQDKQQELSDEEMIAALIGAASDKNKAETPAAPRALSDEELAAALAGCAGTEMDEEDADEPDAEVHDDLGVCDHDVQSWYHENDDADLGMNLFTEGAL